jgi:hypothetical protein
MTLVLLYYGSIDAENVPENLDVMKMVKDKFSTASLNVDGNGFTPQYGACCALCRPIWNH